jgi:hypothetical protein
MDMNKLAEAAVGSLVGKLAADFINKLNELTLQFPDPSKVMVEIEEERIVLNDGERYIEMRQVVIATTDDYVFDRVIETADGTVAFAINRASRLPAKGTGKNVEEALASLSRRLTDEWKK